MDSNWQGDSSEWNANSSEIGIEVLLERYSLEEILQSIIIQINKTIEKNQNKKPILKKRLIIVDSFIKQQKILK